MADAETCLDCGRAGHMIHDNDGDPWCVHHGPFGPGTEPGDCCPHAEPEERSCTYRVVPEPDGFGSTPEGDT